jgi:hypothetical protein
MNFYEGGNEEKHEDNFTKVPETQTDDSIDEIKKVEDIELSDEMQRDREKLNKTFLGFIIISSWF